MKVLSCLIALLICAASPAAAQNYPNRPITIIVPFPPGGPMDIVARMIVDGMSASLGQPMIIENIGGAGGTIGIGHVVSAAPDGYTIGIGHWGTNVIGSAVYQLPFDPITDLRPIGMLGTNPQIIVANSKVPVESLNALRGWLADDVTRQTIALGGFGTPSHVSAVYFEKFLNLKLTLVPYRGGSEPLEGVAAGDVSLMIEQASNALGYLKSDHVKFFAVTTPSRLAIAPGIPTVDEVGLTGFYVSVWAGLWAPKNTADDIIARLNRAMRESLQSEKISSGLNNLGFEEASPDLQSPEGFASWQKAETEKWHQIIRTENIHLE